MINSLRACLALTSILIMTSACEEDTFDPNNYDAYPVYEGNDLGLSFNQNEIRYKLWSPVAEEAEFLIYNEDIGGEPSKRITLNRGMQGTWTSPIPGEFKEKYYTVRVRINGQWRKEVPGPYVKVVGRNGLRGQLIDPVLIHPGGWHNEKPPILDRVADAIIYELHVRDFSISDNSGMKNKGKYLAFTERGTVNSTGLSTGLDHLIDLGITHVHLLPSFDYRTVDEVENNKAQYNWGYDPQNYNVPEGSYATDAKNGGVRIYEFKEMVKSLHEEGIRVIMDVVYNHTSAVEGLSFEETVPGYYYRHWEDGSLSNASGCGNEVASERPMVRKFILNSLRYWMEEYHIDGFRFDLMAIHDIETMRSIEKELHQTRPDLLLYGEGWTAGDSPLAEEKRALKKYTYKMPGIAAFSDEIRDGIKGHWSDHKAQGFISGNFELKESVKFGIVGGIDHPGVDYSKVNNTDTAWATQPTQCIAYVSCHDNHTLFDKLRISNPDADQDELIRMHTSANAIVLTSQAIPFLHAGVEFLRTKEEVENSYNSPDSINQINWDLKSENFEVYQLYRELIHLRKANDIFKMGLASEVVESLKFISGSEELIAYTLNGDETSAWSKVLVAVNGSGAPSALNISGNNWKSVVLDGVIVSDVEVVNPLQVGARSFCILYESN